MMNNRVIGDDVSGAKMLPLSFLSYNCRGMNKTKYDFLSSLLAQSDFLFLQEHWMAEDQVPSLGLLSTSHHCYGVSGFSSNDVLLGRPFGGCAIFWRQGLCSSVKYMETHSRRVCAIRCGFSFGQLLLMNVYMPYEKDDDSKAEFLNTLSVIENILLANASCQVVFGGDFNVDFSRASCNSSVLKDFCVRMKLYPLTDHCHSQVDYSYHFAMRHFHTLDHFIVSEQIFQESVNKMSVIHDVDNLSDHEPIYLHLKCDISRFNVQDRQFVPNIAWHKAKQDDLLAYSACLREALNGIKLPDVAVSCRNAHCKIKSHLSALKDYMDAICNACLHAADQCIPYTAPRAAKGKMPGWNELVEPARQKSLFWHNLWIECGRPKVGNVADIARRTRAAYHYAIRFLRKNEQELVNERFADSVLRNRTRDFWGEVKRMRSTRQQCSSSVDGSTDPDDIAELFADKYKDLYTCVSYDVTEMNQIRCSIEESIIGYDQTCSITVSEVFDAVCRLKPNKSDGNIGLSSDYFVHACTDFYEHVALLFSGLLIHGFVPEMMLCSTVIPIPKGKQCNITNSDNYRGIALSSIFGKVFDLIILNRYSDDLTSCDLQFGFKENRSTDMCTMVLKESVSYYVNNGSSVFCTFLDASKAFDRVAYCQLFRLLIKRGIPAVIMRFLCNMYVNQRTRLVWNGVYSAMFSVFNGVKQGGVASPIMFCLYIDELLVKLADSGVGCWFGKFYVGVLAYADDIVLLAPSASSMRTMLSYCDHFASQYSLVFNANKSKCMLFLPRGKRCACKPVFAVNGHSIEYVDEYVHLGHVISSDLDDARDIDRCRLALIRQINSVLCLFGKLDPVVKMRLLTSYCYSLYGSVIWNLTNNNVEKVCSAWRAGLRRVWGLPATTHNILLPSISCRPPLLDEIAKRFISYIQRCLASESEVVKFVTSYGIGVGRMTSPIGSTAQFCSTKFGFNLRDIHVVSPQICSRYFFRRLDSGVAAISGALLELIFIRNDTMSLSLDLDLDDVSSFIHFLCTSRTIP